MSFITAVESLSPTHWWRLQEESGSTLVDSVADLNMTNNGLTLGVSLPDTNTGVGVEGDGTGYALTSVDNSYRGDNNFTALVFASVKSRGADHRFFYYGPLSGSGTSSTLAIGLSGGETFAVWGPDSLIEATTDPSNDTPVLLCVVNDGGSLRFYTQQVNESALTLQGTTSGGSGGSGDHVFAIGPEGNESRRPDAIIHHPIFWNSALTEAQIQSIADEAFAEEGASGELSFTGDNAIRFADDDTPAGDATVVAVRKGVEATPSQTVTDSNGEATLTGLASGEWRTWAEKEVSGDIKTTQVIIRTVT